MRCPSCDHDNRADRRFCTECGAVLSVACPSCGAPTEAGEKFCGGCGGRLPIAAPAPDAPTPTPEPEAALPAGERRQLTIIFCDLVGSTPLSQQLDAEELRDLIAQYQRAAAGAVVRFGGYVARYLGDGLLIYFGWPTAREDDPERAVRAGLAIVDAMALLNANLAAGDGTRLAVRIGMHTGPVVIADDGEVYGETANIAARVQAAAEPDTVVITAATQCLVAGMFVVEDRGPQPLKGVREPVTLYRVVQPSGVRSRLDVAAGRLTCFVGREVELATLVDRWERAQHGEGQNVIVLGDAGVGKSRLVYQLHERLTAVPHTWLECDATPYTEGTPFHPMIAMVAQGLAFTSEDTPAEKFGKLEVGLGALASTETVALLADFLGLPPPTRLQLSPELQRRKTIDLLAQWNLAMSEAQPLVVFVEDLHWCDASTLELLGQLIAQSPTARVLLLATARPEFTLPWPARSNLTTVQLARLTKRQARHMVTTIMEGAAPSAPGGGGRGSNGAPPSMSDDVIDALVARADGVPLYVEELMKAMAEPGAARSVEAIPATLADSLMARLDRLSTAKEVAQRAAVLGREFSYLLLAAVAGLEEAALRQGLTKLVEAEIVFVRGKPPQATYTFKHALVQEAAYGSLLKRTRQQLHARVAQALEVQFPEPAARKLGVVAHHYDAAGLQEQAVAYYQQAGEQAAARSAHEEAVAHLRRAIAVLNRLPERDHDGREAGLQRALAPSLTAVRGYAHPETEAAYERARVLYSAAGDRENSSWALHGLANVCLNLAKFQRALDLIEQALEVTETAQGDVYIAAAHAQKSTIYYYQGRFEAALEHAETATRLYGPAGHYRPGIFSPFGADECVGSQSSSAWTLWQLGYPDQALARARESIEFATMLDHPFSIAHARFFEVVVHWMRRDVVAQRQTAEVLIRFAGAQRFPLFVGIATTFRGHALGDPAGIIDGLTRAAGTGTQCGAPMIFTVLAEAYQGCGKLAEALDAVETGLAIAAQTGQPFFDAELHRLQGEITLKTVDSPQSRVESQKTGEECFHRALDIARAQEAKSIELRATTSLARLWQCQGERAAARALLAPLYVWFTEGFDTRDLQEAKALLEELR